MEALSYAFKKSMYSPVELYDLGNQVANATGEIVARTETGKQLEDLLNGSLGKLNAATEREKANPKTAEIHAADKKRDDILFMTRDTLRANMHNTVSPEAREAGTTLFRLFNAHIGGNIKQIGLGAETKAVKYLLEALDSEENKKRCAVLGLQSIVADLANTQARVESLYAERTASELEASQIALKKAMEAAADALRRYLGYIDVLNATQSQDAPVIEAKVRAIVNDVETIARGRITRMGNAPGPEEKSGENDVNKAA